MLQVHCDESTFISSGYIGVAKTFAVGVQSIFTSETDDLLVIVPDTQATLLN